MVAELERVAEKNGTDVGKVIRLYVTRGLTERKSSQQKNALSVLQKKTNVPVAR